MRILITNDDGIHAKGLEILKAIALGLSPDVWTVAPETNQSGTSHSMTLHTPLRLRTVDERTFAVAGTPTDCVIMAVRHILKDQPPDLILSGINHGSNLADDITYSGTVAAAMEGTILGIRSIALSLMMGFEEGSRRALWETPLAHAPSLITKLLADAWHPGSLINVNFPDVAPDEVAGISITEQGVRVPETIMQSESVWFHRAGDLREFAQNVTLFTAGLPDQALGREHFGDGEIGAVEKPAYGQRQHQR